MKRLLVALLTLCSVTSFAQKRIVYGKVSVGNYWMRHVKDLQEELEAKLIVQGIPAEIVLSFPVSLQGEVGMDFSLGDDDPHELLLGGFANYMVTEGLITYSDYSGRMDVQQNFRRYSVGVKGARSLNEMLHGYLKVSYHHTRLSVVAQTTLSGNQPERSDFRLDPKGVALEPGVQWIKSVKRFNFTAHAGYELSFVFNGDLYLLNDAGDAVQPDWSGFRLGLGVGFEL